MATEQQYKVAQRAYDRQEESEPCDSDGHKGPWSDPKYSDDGTEFVQCLNCGEWMN